MKRIYVLLLLVFMSITLTACGLSDAENKYNSGVDKYNKKDLTGAMADFNDAIKLDPNLAVAYMNRGAIYIAQKDYDNGIADETKAIDLKLSKTEDQATALTNRAAAHVGKNEFDMALTDTAAAIAANGSYSKAYYIQGLAHASKNDNEAAITDFKKVLELDKDSDTGKAAQAALTQLGQTP